MQRVSYRSKFWLSALCISVCGISLSAFAGSNVDKNILEVPIVSAKPSAKVSASLQSVLASKLQCARQNPVVATVQLNQVPDSFKSTLEGLGIHVLGVSKTYHLASVELNCASQLNALTKLPEVLYVSKSSSGSSNQGEAPSYSIHTLNVSQVIKQLPNLTGKGIRIGVISTSFAHSSGVRGADTTPARCQSGILRNAKDQLTGDLPAQVELRNDGCSTGNTGADSDEGAAMAEIVHDIAPGAAISFHEAGASQVTFAQAINDLCKPRSLGGAGANIVVDDMSFYDEPYFQPGIVTKAVENCVHHGVMYFSSAGNDYNHSYTFSYDDINPNKQDSHPSNGDKIIYGNDFQKWPNGSAFLPITVPAGSHFRVDLQWNQPFISFQKVKRNFPLSDFDLYIMAKDPKTHQMKTLYSSQDRQGKGFYNNPNELVLYSNDSKQTKTVYLVVNHWSGNAKVLAQNSNVPVKLNLRFPDSSDDVKIGLPYNAASMYGHVFAPGLISVAAMPWYGSMPYYYSQQQAFPEDFSSKGAFIHREYFNVAGSYQPSFQSVPTITGTDGDDTTFFGNDIPASKDAPGEPDGLPNFFGTSAAAPAVAAVAALLKQYAGPYVPNAFIRRAMVSTARDVVAGRASKGWDPITGAGEVDAQAALRYLKKELGRE